MKVARAEAKRLREARGTIILPKKLVRLLKAIGINPRKAHLADAVTLEAYRNLQRAYDAKAQRVEWQSSGIRGLWEQVATLKAELDTLRSALETDQVAQLAARVVQLEADQVLREVT